VSLKEAIERQLKIPTQIRMGGPGSFDVRVDGEQIFSKKQTGRMPQQGEILRMLQAKQAPG
jgi:selT/selW/selH-like putative selenoprotein